MPRISITEPGKESQAYRFDIKRMKVTIGRRSESDITILHRSVSKHHCTIERLKGGLKICDQESTNGLFLDGERMSEITLTNGMEFEIGDISAVFSLSYEECDQLTDERFTAKREVQDEEEVAQSED